MKLRLVLTIMLALVRQTPALSPDELQQIGFSQKIGQPISGDLVFRDADGTKFELGAHFGNKPTLLLLGYYHCPMLCTFINSGLIQALQELRPTAGKDFDIVDLSIDPRETPALAVKKKAEYNKLYGRRDAENGWHFLTGDEGTITEITREAGFHFAYDPRSNEYAHPSGVIALTPQGKISRYFLGVNFDAREIAQAITAARNEENGSIVQRLALICYHYNPITGKYGALIMSILRLGGIATVLAIGLSIFLLARKGSHPQT